jgi:uncharacterized phage-associated protein
VAETTARAVAEYILHFSAKHGDLITNLRLQKLLYYAQAWHLAIYDKPLFDEHFEAWVHGPAQPDIYRHFKSFGSQPIPPPEQPQPVSLHVCRHTMDVLKAYGRFSAYDLERYTHHESPWTNARKGLSADFPSSNTISQADMRECYRRRLNETAQ